MSGFLRGHGFSCMDVSFTVLQMFIDGSYSILSWICQVKYWAQHNMCFNTAAYWRFCVSQPLEYHHPYSNKTWTGFYTCCILLWRSEDMDTWIALNQTEGVTTRRDIHYKVIHNNYNNNLTSICLHFVICRYTYANVWVFRRSQKSSHWWAVPLHNSKKVLHPHSAAASHFESFQCGCKLRYQIVLNCK